MIFTNIFIFTLVVLPLSCTQLTVLQDLPEEHIPYFFDNNPEIANFCRKNVHCPYQNLQSRRRCWGYEHDCPIKDRMHEPECPHSAERWAKSKEEQLEKFWTSADFGYIKERKSELTEYCSPFNTTTATLSCSSYTRYCTAKDIFLDFSTADLKSKRDRFREDVFKEGQLGAFCKFNKEQFHKLGEHKSPLQSWFGELQHFRGLAKDPFSEGQCDIIIDKPTYFMKLDAGVNMYHHFCDFVNLYMSQHLNNSFSRDIQIIMWDTSPMSYYDIFSETFQVFSKHPMIHLNTYDKKKLCVRDAVFPLLPRMRYGHYYNMPLIPGCEKSSMYRAFSQHVLHRLDIQQQGPLRTKVRVTILSRKSKYRNILNEDELVEALRGNKKYEVKVAEYNGRVLPFIEQLKITQNSDIFIGMHGAGLTHALFQPDWGVVFEIHNCEDKNCYKDLARLRGVKYMTWENLDKLVQEDEGHHPTLGAHKKFTNYSFDVKEFLRLVQQGADHVRGHQGYQAAWQLKYGEQKLPREDL